MAGPKTAENQHHIRMLEEHGGEMRVGYRQDNDDLKGGTTWKYWRSGDKPYHLRTLPNHLIIFDIGDHGDWARAVVETHALWFALNRMRIPWAGALSGGKGTHTEVWGPRVNESGVDDWRGAAAGSILEVANKIYAGMVGDEWAIIETDHRLLAPKAHNQLVREYGAHKFVDSTYPKMLWAEGPGVFPLLPLDNTEAYKKAAGGATSPASVRRDDSLDRFDRSWMKCVGEGRCPVGPKCIPSNRDAMDWMGCDECPMVSGY